MTFALCETRTRLFGCSVTAILTALAAPAAAQPQAASSDAAAQSSADQGGESDIIVTARKREESLLSVPVAVTAFSAADIARYKSNNIASLTESVPTVLVSNYRVNGGGTLSIRGVGTPGSLAGFEQAVSVSIDGVQISSARLLGLGTFDLQQAEILKGPQALFFGKNSPAGVISLKSKGPTDRFEAYVKGSYEVVADEAMIEGAISGPLTETLSARLAVRYRDMKGWMYNDAGPIDPNPFNPALPIVNDVNHRPGERELLGRLTLVYEPGNNFKTTLKVTGSRYRDDGPGTKAQDIGPCPSGRPIEFAGGIAATDPYGECKPDNHTTNGNFPAAVGSTLTYYHADNQPFSADETLTMSLISELDLGDVSLVSTTGYIHWNQRSVFGFDQTSFSQIGAAETDRQTYISQEIRALTDFDGPINLMLGAYYQSTKHHFRLDTTLSNIQNPAVPLGTRCYNPANGRFSCFIRGGDTDGETLSGFGQAIWNVTPKLELAAGARYTRETKTTDLTQPYGVGPFDISNVIYAESRDQTPGHLEGRFRGGNWSPEATLSYHPTRDSTIYVAYKTGYKSGGFGLSSPMTAASRLTGYAFGPEKVKGFELGAKGRLMDGRLTLEATAFDYKFSDLQVTIFNSLTTSFTIQNAGELRQRGLELQGSFKATDKLNLRGAVAYTDNKFHDFVGQCYGYRFPAGTTRGQLGGAAAGVAPVAPQGCQFASPAASGSLVINQDFDGRRPARSPTWSGNAGFTFDQPVRDMTLSLSGDAVYSSGYYPGETMAPGSYQDSFWRLNASARLIGMDDKWEVALIGRNLTNEYYVTFALDKAGGLGPILSPNEQRGTVARGREITAELTYRF